MVQSDALSRRPDHCPDQDNDNNDIIMLPDGMFINLIDTTLQNRIAESHDLDKDAAEALKLILEQGPSTMTTRLLDWTTENINGRNVLFYKGMNYIPKNLDLRWCYDFKQLSSCQQSKTSRVHFKFEYR